MKEKKLTLKKLTIAKLQEQEQKKIKGGQAYISFLCSISCVPFTCEALTDARSCPCTIQWTCDENCDY